MFFFSFQINSTAHDLSNRQVQLSKKFTKYLKGIHTRARLGGVEMTEQKQQALNYFFPELRENPWQVSSFKVCQTFHGEKFMYQSISVGSAWVWACSAVTLVMQGVRVQC